MLQKDLPRKRSYLALVLLRKLCTRHNVDEAFHAMAKEPCDGETGARRNITASFFLSLSFSLALRFWWVLILRFDGFAGYYIVWCQDRESESDQCDLRLRCVWCYHVTCRVRRSKTAWHVKILILQLELGAWLKPKQGCRWFGFNISFLSFLSFSSIEFLVQLPNLNWLIPITI